MILLLKAAVAVAEWLFQHCESRWFNMSLWKIHKCNIAPKAACVIPYSDVSV